MTQRPNGQNRRRVGAVLALLAAGTVAPGLVRAQTGTAWPTFHGDMQRTGYSTVTGPTSSMVANRWNTAGSIAGSAAVDANGVAYAGDSKGNVYAFSTKNTSSPLWTFVDHGNSPFFAGPSLSPDGKTLYIGSDDGTLYALNTSNGKQVWAANTGGPIHAAPLVSPDGGTIYTASNTGFIGSYSASAGTPIKSGGFSGIAIPGEIALTTDNSTLYAGGTTGVLDGFATSDLSTTKPYETTGASVYGMSLDQSNNIYAISDTGANGFLDVFNQGNQSAAWSVSIAGGSYTTPAVGNNTVVVGSNTGNVIAYSTSSHSQVWSAQTRGPVSSSPIIAGSVVYAASQDGRIYAFNLTSGAPLPGWPTADILGAIYASPAISSDGSLWVGTTGNLMVRLHDTPAPPPPPSGGAPTPPPPTPTPIVNNATPPPVSTPLPTATPVPSPTLAPAPTFGLGKVTAKANKSKVRRNTTVKITVSVQVKKDTAATQLKVNWSVLNGKRKTVGHHGTHKNLSANQTGRFTFSWKHRFTYPGTYVVKVAAKVGNKTAHRSVKITVTR